MPFELPVPHGLVPSFTSESHQLSWSIRVVVDSWLGLSQAMIEVPIEIVAGSPSDRAVLAPHVADQRVVDLLASLAGWQLAGLAVTRTLEDASLEIGYDYRGEDGTFLVAKIHHPPLGLELSVVPSSTLRSLFVKDVEVDIAAWDRRHHVMVRSPDQALPMLQAVVPALADQTALGTLVRWTDDEIVFEQGVIDLDRDLLAAIASSLERVAAAITAGIALVAPPLPIDLEAWRELARWLDGDLVLGDLSIHGELDGVRVQLGLAFDRHATPVGVHVEVGEPRDGDPPPFDGVIDDAIDLAIAPGIASATSQGVDSLRTRALVETLRGVVAERGGPYR
jgi:hypothetical protein